MAQWLLERGIGEDRAILVENDAILAAEIVLPGGPRQGEVCRARLTAILIPGRRGIVTLSGGGEALIEPIPAGVTEGAALNVEIVREALPEAGRPKLAKARATDQSERAGPDLAERIGRHREIRPGDGDAFEVAGWSELLDEAASGEIAFPGGALRMSITPAMTLFDVDGVLEPEALAAAGAAAAGRAIRRLNIGGSIGIDLPTLSAKPARLAAAEALDAVLPQPFERTAVNGFGFLQVVRRRARPSIPELLRADPPGAAARALLRKGERMIGAVELIAPPAVAARLETEAAWLDALARRTGGAVRLRADPGRTTFAGYVHQTQS